ncbi:MAG: class I SAM-dependent methyltransferase [Planctomycetes bacterium]|nr:class I SAM-dependent methyltransferase [Planctomycetota bacterium]
MPKPDREPWFVRAFGPEYLALYAHRSEAEARKQVVAILDSGLLPRKGRILDLCCGAGRHLKVLRAQGLGVFGLDLSMDLLRAGSRGWVVRADMRRVPYADGSFAAVLSLFTSFGYFDDAENLGVLREIRRVLEPGGRVVIDTINPGPTIAALKPETVESTDAGTLRARRRVEGRRIIKDIELVRGGETRRWHESVMVFEPAELDGMLAKAGLKTVARYADLGGGRFELANSPRQAVVAAA